MVTVYWISALENNVAYVWDGFEWKTNADEACEFRVEDEAVDEFDAVAINNPYANMSLEKGQRLA